VGELDPATACALDLADNSAAIYSALPRMNVDRGYQANADTAKIAVATLGNLDVTSCADDVRAAHAATVNAWKRLRDVRQRRADGGPNSPGLGDSDIIEAARAANATYIRELDVLKAATKRPNAAPDKNDSPGH
jgi:hypothetical protein